MSDKPISPLRQRMIDDMTARRISEATRKDYVRNVRNFRPSAGGRQRRARTFAAFSAYGAAAGRPWSINAAIAALRFFSP